MLFHINTVPVTISCAEGLRYSSPARQRGTTLLPCVQVSLGSNSEVGALPRDFCFAPMNGHREMQRPVMRILPIGLTLLASAKCLIACLVDFFEQWLDPTKVLGTHLCQGHPPRRALEQTHTKFIFERCDHPGNGRWVRTAIAGYHGKAAAPRHLNESSQRLDVHSFIRRMNVVRWQGFPKRR